MRHVHGGMWTHLNNWLLHAVYKSSWSVHQVSGRAMLVGIQQLTRILGYLKCHAITIFRTVTETHPRVGVIYRVNCVFLYGDILGEHVVDVEKWCYNVIVHRDHCGCGWQNKSNASEPESRRQVSRHRTLKTVSNLININTQINIFLRYFNNCFLNV